MGNDASDEYLIAAYAALEARQQSPAASLATAVDLLARPDLSSRARLVALWAQGSAERELNRLASSEAHLREAIDIGEQIGDGVLVARVSSALVVVVTARGRLGEALALADSIRDALPAAERADLDMKRAIALEHLGRPGEALDAYGTALAEVQAGADRVLEARLRCNRSVVLAYRGRTAEALVDAGIAEQLASEHEQWFLAGGSAHNHAFTAGLHGDLVTALASFARAEEWYSRVGHPGRSAGVLASDRCEVLLAAGLFSEARASAQRAVDALGALDDVVDLAEARLLLARACLADGDPVSARREAEEAHAQFAASGRDGWSIAARFVAFDALHRIPGSDDMLDLDEARQMADELHTLGWPSESAVVRVAAAEIAIRRGDGEFARQQLRIAGNSRSHGRADRRANAWLATARLRALDGNRSGAKRALGAGLRVVAQHQTTLGATDLRVGATVHAGQLADLGLSMAVDDGGAADVLGWAERVRANALARPAVRPPDDAPLAVALVELRRVRSEFVDARRAGGHDPSLAEIVSRQEAVVRDLARVATGSGAGTRPFSIAELRERLGPSRQLVEFVESNGAVSSVVVTDRACRLRQHGATATIRDLIDAATFSVGRLARTGASEASMAAAESSFTDAMSQLDELLVAPLRLDADELVVVPTGVLHGMPWGGLPSLRALPFSVAMSARRWQPVGPLVVDDRLVGAVVGPGLVDEAGELASVTSARPAAETLAGDGATVEAVLALLDRSAVVHLACHGNLRSDSPMFSSLTLADGPLTIYDVEALSSPPALVILPACHAAAAAVGVGDEVLGTASALLGAGVRAVIAPVTVVNDEATVGVMAMLHRRLAGGLAPNAALAAVRGDVEAADATVRAVVASLQCLE